MAACCTSPASSMPATLRRCGSMPVSFTDTCLFRAKRHILSCRTLKYAASMLTASPSGDKSTYSSNPRGTPRPTATVRPSAAACRSAAVSASSSARCVGPAGSRPGVSTCSRPAGASSGATPFTTRRHSLNALRTSWARASDSARHLASAQPATLASGGAGSRKRAAGAGGMRHAAAPTGSSSSRISSLSSSSGTPASHSAALRSSGLPAARWAAATAATTSAPFVLAAMRTNSTSARAARSSACVPAWRGSAHAACLAHSRTQRTAS